MTYINTQGQRIECGTDQTVWSVGTLSESSRFGSFETLDMAYASQDQAINLTNENVFVIDTGNGEIESWISIRDR